jgi:hypothetical protein
MEKGTNSFIPACGYGISGYRIPQLKMLQGL